MRCSQQIVRETNNLKLYAWQTLSFLWKVQQIQRFFFCIYLKRMLGLFAKFFYHHSK